MSIVLLDEDPNIRAQLTDTLTVGGYSVRIGTTLDDMQCAADGGELVAAVIHGWDENETVAGKNRRRALRDLAQAVPTIVVTERAWTDTISPADLGLLGLIRKPFEVADVVGLIERAAESRTRERRGPSHDLRLRVRGVAPRRPPSRASQRLHAFDGASDGVFVGLRRGADRASSPRVAKRCLFDALRRLLAFEATDLKTALTRAAQQITEALHADKVDVFIHEPSSSSLVALGTGQTPMGRLQQRLGLHRQPLDGGGSAARIFRTGQALLIRDTRCEGDEPPSDVERLGVRSEAGVPLTVQGERRGVLLVGSTAPDCFSDDDLGFLEAVANWVGLVGYRSALVEHTVVRAEQESRHSAVADTIARLTPRQREVSALVARGLTNAEIAERLVLSPGTAANHVEHILRRLGFASRAQIAALFGQLPR